MAFSERLLIPPGSHVARDEVAANAPDDLTREQAERKTRKANRRLAKLQYLLFANAGPSLLIVLQGPDAAGKDGLIRHLFGGLNPQGVTVTAFAKPTAIEARHDFLWRVHRSAPAKGEIAVFNRSHYEAVLVERVRELVTPHVWHARFAMINAFEELLAQNGTRILKFFLHIDADEQLERFRRRLEDKRRQWKISEDDYADRQLWPQFVEANQAMLERTSTPAAPWYVIPANQKWYRNFAVSKIVVAAVKDLGLTIPPPTVDIAEIRRKYHAAARSRHEPAG
jgi:PPK2 family polyphosphate:nucleotide phosphotransferase